MEFVVHLNPKNWDRYKKYCKEDPNSLKPFFFRCIEQPECLMCFNHGYSDGGIYDYTSNSHLTTSQFYKKFCKKLMDKYPEFEQVVLFCCHGAKVINDMEEEQFCVANQTDNVLLHSPATHEYEDEEGYELTISWEE